MFFIINQHAKLGKANLIFKDKIRPLLQKNGVSFDYALTAEFDDTVVQAQKAAQANDIVVACGGDGTVNAVAQGILGTKAALGVLPLGSANNFAVQSLNIPINFKKAIKILLRKKIIKIDVGKINEAIFLNTVGIGITGQVSLLGHKHWFYRFLPPPELRYGLPLLERLSLFKPFHLTIKTNSRLVFQGQAFLVIICNGKGEAKYFISNEKSNLCNNSLSLMIIEDVPPLRRLQLLYKVLIGNVNKLKESEKDIVHFFHSSDIQLNFKQDKQSPLFFHIDGEPVDLVENQLYHNVFLTDNKQDKTNVFAVKVLPQILPVIIN
jgi:YegS/Rv2252/BmrU family lipid kinase